jgi:ketosteroid isomerase-like protein
MTTPRVLVILLSALLLACRAGLPVPDGTAVIKGGVMTASANEEIPPDLLAAVDAFYDAIETDNHEARIEMFTEDAIMMPDHGLRLEGKTAIAEVIRAGSGSVFRIRDREIIDMDVDGELAHTVNSYFYTYHSVGAEARWQKTNNVHIWKRDGEGKWKVQVDIWNSDSQVTPP